MTAQKSTLSRVIDEFQSLGFIVHHYPRKKSVSISGFPAIHEKQAVEKMRAMIQKSKAGRGGA